MLELKNTGKVRDSYAVSSDPSRLVVVATDRISAYDVVMTEGVPRKGRVLTAVSLFWFDALKGKLATQTPVLLDKVDLDAIGLHDEFLGRTTSVRRAEMVPIECVVRGYLAGSAWKEYLRYQSVGDIAMRSGLMLGSKLDRPVFTPTTKEAEGHDLPLSLSQLRARVGTSLACELEEISLFVYGEAMRVAADKGLVIADTKFEFGYIDGKLALCDEVLTPDSSRYWRVESMGLGREPVQLDKQILRDWLSETGWNGAGRPPTLDAKVIEKLSLSYVAIYETLSGLSFTDWPGNYDLRCYLGERTNEYES
jgi:phosphoribosylaminoimidazole-succinocarboxamide synthase